MPLFGCLRYWNWKSPSMPRGIGYNCTQSPPIQSLHPLYWAELEMSASVTGVLGGIGMSPSVTGVERAVTKAGSSMAGGVELPHGWRGRAPPWSGRGRAPPWPGRGRAPPHPARAVTEVGSSMAGGVELPNGRAGAELLRGRAPPQPVRAVMEVGSMVSGVELPHGWQGRAPPWSNRGRAPPWPRSSPSDTSGHGGGLLHGRRGHAPHGRAPPSGAELCLYARCRGRDW